MKLTTIILTAIMMHSGLLMATEEPAFTLIKQSEPFELRLYAPRIIAETAGSGNMKRRQVLALKPSPTLFSATISIPAVAKQKISV